MHKAMFTMMSFALQGLECKTIQEGQSIQENERFLYLKSLLANGVKFKNLREWLPLVQQFQEICDMYMGG